MIPISEVVDRVEVWLELPNEDAVNLVCELITKERVRVEDWDENDRWVLITDEQREKTRVEDGKVQIGSKFVSLDFQCDGFNREMVISHHHRHPAGTKTTAKAAREPRINWLSVFTAVENCRKAAGIEERPARSPAGLRPGRKPKYNHKVIAAAFAAACCFGKGINEPNQSTLIDEVKNYLVQICGYAEEDLPGPTMLKEWASVVMRFISQVDEKEASGGGR